MTTIAVIVAPGSHITRSLALYEITVISGVPDQSSSAGNSRVPFLRAMSCSLMPAVGSCLGMSTVNALSRFFISVTFSCLVVYSVINTNTNSPVERCKVFINPSLQSLETKLKN